MVSTPKGINYFNLREAANSPAKEEQPLRVIKASDLVKVGGLYRIRDDYTAVWRLQADEDGKRYIIRADDGGAASPERLLVTSEASAEDSAKAASAVGFKVIHAGAVYVAWECEACATPNLTKFGNMYECDECHKRYADVLRTEEQQRIDKQSYTRAEVAEYEPEFAKRMGELGIRVAHKSLLQVWDAEHEAKKKKDIGSCLGCGRAHGHAPGCNLKGVHQASSGKEWDKEAGEAVNPWAVCHTTVDKDKNPEKYERCVMDIKKKGPIKKD